ncbi:MAG: lipocalin family protein [Flavobacteriales bacterium]|jgi:hypothetical protein
MKKLSILFAAFAVVLLASCGKYEDGPGFSLRSKTSRLAGTWTVTEAFQGSTDITGDITNGGTVEVTFDKDGAYTYAYDFEIFGIPTSGSVSGTWSFSDDKTEIVVTDGSGQSDSAKILRLTNQELWIEEPDGSGGTYEVHYSAK